MDRIHLIGSEDVRRAGGEIQYAAEQIARAAEVMAEAMRQFTATADQLLIAMAEVRDAMKEAKPHD